MRSHRVDWVSVPLRNSRHSRPAPWMSRLLSRPGIDAYCGRSLVVSHEGGLFQPGTMVEPLAGVGGDDAFAASAAGAAGFSGAAFVGAVAGGVGDAGACASAASGSARAAPSISAPQRRARDCSMDSSFLFLGVAGADVFVLVVRALRQRLLVFLLVSLEAIAGIGLGVLLAGIGLRRVLRD